MNQKAKAPAKRKRKRRSSKKSVEQRISEGLMSKAALFGQRGKVYGRNYMVFGDVMAGMFPAGLTLKTKEDFVRLGLFVQIVSKITRYSNAFSTGHADSLDDNSVYSQMLAVVDQDVIKRHIGDRR